MKRIFDFVYCKGSLTPAVVWYSVRCGISKADIQARQYIERLAASSNDYLFAKHSADLQEFQNCVAASLFPSAVKAGKSPLSLLRRHFVEVTVLARFLRSCPPQLLNSEALAHLPNPFHV